MLRTLSYILHHPLNRGHRFAALCRYAGWQIKSRLNHRKFSVPYVQGTRLMVSKGMTGATGNIYCGLQEFPEMAFILHALRPGDLFIDVGANVGSYTILAAGVVHARVMSLEPVPGTFAHLAENVRVNSLEKRVRLCNVAAGSKHDRLEFTRSLDTTNHVISPGDDKSDTLSVEVIPLDELLKDENDRESPVLMKVDVEGFETEVIRGAQGLLKSPRLWGIIMELNGSGARYGYDERRLDEFVLSQGFTRAEYHPFARKLNLTGLTPAQNSIYIREIDSLAERVRSAPSVHINGVDL